MKNRYLLALFMLASRVFAGWNNLNTGINDNITGVVFWGNNGALSGYNGLYYTTTGGVGPASWARFNITGNPSDSLVYNHTQFRHAFSDPTGAPNQVFICGKDMVTNNAVIMLLNFPALTYSIIYNGSSGSGLNKINYSVQGNSFYAVGENGLIINFTASSASAVVSGFSNNFSSISFSGSQFCIGSNGMVINGTNNFGTLSYTVSNTPLYNYSDVTCTGYKWGFGVGNSYFKWTGSTPVDQPAYDFGNLNARCMSQISNSHFVGTDHGIFKSNNIYAFLEWQPTSLNYSVNCFWSSGSVIYACGDNGTLLSTTDNGGVAKPVAKLYLTGACKNVNLNIGGITGSSSNCQWYINNTYVSSACGSFPYLFSTAGQYTVELDVSNGPGLYDTAVQVINIVDPPNINLPVSISKSTLCKQEPIAIIVNSSQVNTFYTLKKFGSLPSYGFLGNGTGGTVTFTSPPLSESGNYYLVAQSTLASCLKNFTDTIKIGVEKTKAAFYANKVNVTPGETLTCYQRCTDAQNYAWTFSPNASAPTSTLANPSLVFGTTGATQVKLVCWSNNGCYDSTQVAGPAVYNEPSPLDSCWTMVNNGIDLQGASYIPDVSQVTLGKNNFYTCGRFNEETFASRLGDSVETNIPTGGYAIKYSLNGAAKWKIFTREDPASMVSDNIRSVVEDKAGNIFICGMMSGALYDNTGDSLYGTPTGSVVGFIAKLDSLGKLKWLSTSNAFNPLEISFDKNENLLVIARGAGSGTVYLNGVPSYTFGGSVAGLAFIKVSTAGAIQWGAKMQYYYGGSLDKITVDKYNNMYVMGTTGQKVDLYSVGSSTFTTVTGVSGNNLFLAKYDSMGILKWTVRSRTQGIVNDRTFGYSMVTDSLGNCYISGSNFCLASSNPHIFENADASITSHSAGRYFVAKVNSSGICKWIQGAAFSYYGDGYLVNKFGNEISVLGQISQNNYTLLQNSVFTSSNNDTLSLTIGSSDYFIAIYDTAGVLKRITTNGTNSVTIMSSFGFASGFHRRSDGAYYFGRNITFFMGTANYNNFGTNIVSTNDIDGSVTRAFGNCGITTYPVPVVTSLQESDLTNWKIYPNPSGGLFVVESDRDETINIEIFDQMGKVIRSQTGRKKVALDMRGSASGIYTIRILTAADCISKKIILE